MFYNVLPQTNITRKQKSMWENQTGIPWLNKPKDSFPAFIGNIFKTTDEAIKERDKLKPKFSQTPEEVIARKSFINSSQTNKSSQNLGIHRNVKSNFYHTSPQSSTQDFDKIMNLKVGDQLTFFDLETVGGLPGDETYFSPIEASFVTYNISSPDDPGVNPLTIGQDLRGNKHGLVEDSVLNILMSPDGEGLDYYENIINKVDKKEILLDHEKRSFMSLMQYGDEVNLKDYKGEVTGVSDHAPWFREYKKTASAAVLGETTVEYTNAANKVVSKKINPLEQARKGLDTLTGRGLDKSSSMHKINEVMGQLNNKGSSLLGHNSGPFDLAALERMGKEVGIDLVSPDLHLDTYDLMKSTIESPLEMNEAFKEIGIDLNKLEVGGKGPNSLENLVPQVKNHLISNHPELVDQLDNMVETHVAIQDARDHAMVFQQMKGDIYEAYDGKLAYDLDVNIHQDQYSIDISDLKKGDVLHAQRGYSLNDNTTDALITQSGEVSKSTQVINSKMAYEVTDQFVTEVDGKNLHGIELLNPTSGDTSIIQRENKGDLANFVQGRFKNLGDISSNQIMEINESHLQDLSRARHRKLWSARQGGGYWNLNKFHEATTDFRKWRDQTLTNDHILNKAINEVDGFGSGYAKRIKDHLGNRNLGDISVSDMKKIPYMKDDVAERLGEFYTQYRSDSFDQYYSENIDTLKDIFRLNDKGDIKGDTIDSFVRDFKYLGKRLDSEYEFTDMVLKEAGKIEEGRSNVKKNLFVAEMGQQKLLEEHTDRIRLPEDQRNVIKTRSGDIIPINEQAETSKNLSGKFYKSREGRKHGNKALNRAELATMLDDYKDFLPEEDVDNIMHLLRTQEGTGSASDAFTSSLVRNRDKLRVPIEKQFIDIESLSARVSKGNPNVPLKNASGALSDFSPTELADTKKRINTIASEANEIQSYISEDNPFRFKQSTSKMIDSLDDLLNDTYHSFGLENKPMTMKNVLENFVTDIRHKSLNQGQELGITVMDTTKEGNPMISIGLSSMDQHHSVESMTVIDLPLIDPEGYMQTGLNKKIAPLAFLDRFLHGNNYFSSGSSSHLGDGVYLHSAFDKAVMPIHDNLDEIIRLTAEGKVEDATRLSSKSLNKGIKSFAGTNPYRDLDHFDLNQQGKLYDYMKRNTIGTEAYWSYADVESGEIYDSADNLISKKENIFAGQVPTKILANELSEKDGHIRSINSLMGKYLGEGLEYNLATARGPSLPNVMAVPLFDIRDFLSLSYFNDAGRDNMIQSINSRPLTKEFMDFTKRQRGFSSQEMVTTELKDNFVKDLLSKNSGEIHDFQSRTRLVSGSVEISETMLNLDNEVKLIRDLSSQGKLDEYIEELSSNPATTTRAQKLKRMAAADRVGNLDELVNESYDLHSSVFRPSVEEDQFLFRESWKGQRTSEKSTKIRIKDDHRDAVFNPDIIEAIEQGEGGSEYRVNEDTVLFEYKGADGSAVKKRYGKTLDTVIDGVGEDSQGKFLSAKERYSLKDGTKMFIKSEKATAHGFRGSDDLFDLLFGDVDFVSGSDFLGHGAHGDIISGQLEDLIGQINLNENLKYEDKKRLIQELSDSTSELFGLDMSVNEMPNKEGFHLTYESGPKKGFSDIYTRRENLLADQNSTDSERIIKKAKGRTINEKVTLEDYEANLNKIAKKAGIDRDSNVITAPTNVSGVNEIWRAKAFEENPGGGGVKLGPRESTVFRAKKMTETSNWIEDAIAESVDKAESHNQITARIAGETKRSHNLREIIKDEFNVLEHLESSGPEGSHKFQNIPRRSVNQLHELRKSDSKIAGLKKGVYNKEEIINTVIDPFRDEFMLELPHGFEVNKGGKNIEKIRINEVYMSKSRMESIEGGSLVKSKVSRAQESLVDAVVNYEEIYDMDPEEFSKYKRIATEVQNKNNLDHVAFKAYRESEVEKALQNYYNEITVDLTGSKGQYYDKLLSAKVDGSSINLLKTLSPTVEFNDDMFDSLDLTDESPEVRKRIQDLRTKFSQDRGKLHLTDGYGQKIDKFENNTMYIGKNRASEMLGVSEDVIDSIHLDTKFSDIGAVDDENLFKLIKDMKGEGGFAVNTRYPNKDPDTSVLIKTRISDSVEGDTIWGSNSIVHALSGDSDGDTSSIALIKNRMGRDFSKEFQFQQELIEARYTDGVQDKLLDYGRSTGGAQPMERLINEKNTISTMVGSQAESLIVKAKTTNPALTGYANNVGEQIRDLGLTYFAEGNDFSDLTSAQFTDISDLQKVIGDIIQAPIAGKHASGYGVSDIDDIVINTLEDIKGGNFDNLHNYLNPKGERIVADDGVDILKKLHAKVNAVNPNHWGDVSSRIFKSTQLAQRGLNETFSAIFGDERAGLSREALSKYANKHAIEGFNEAYFGTVSGMEKAKQSVYKQTLPKLDEYNKGMDSLEKAEQAMREKTSVGLNAVADKLRNSRIGIGGAAAIAGAGVIAGAMGSAGLGDLPMDYMDQPSAMPRGGDDSASVTIQENQMMGFDVNVSGGINSTLDQSPEELAGIVSQALQGPNSMDIRIKSQDNRNSISEDWIRRSILDLI